MVSCLATEFRFLLGGRFHIVRILMSGEIRYHNIWSYCFNLTSLTNTDSGELGRRVTPRITGTPRTPRRTVAPSNIVPSPGDLALEKHFLWKQFEAEWDQVNVSDIVKSKAQRELFKQVSQGLRLSRDALVSKLDLFSGNF